MRYFHLAAPMVSVMGVMGGTRDGLLGGGGNTVDGMVRNKSKLVR